MTSIHFAADLGSHQDIGGFDRAGGCQGAVVPARQGAHAVIAADQQRYYDHDNDIVRLFFILNSP